MRESISLTWRKIPERYRLIGSKCVTCGSYYFPRRKICPKCRRKGKLEDVELSKTGKVYTFTKIYVPPTGFEKQAPYLMAGVELDDGVKVTGQIVDADLSEVKIGSRVEAIFRIIQKDDPEGLIHYGFKFRLLKD